MDQVDLGRMGYTAHASKRLQNSTVGKSDGKGEGNLGRYLVARRALSFLTSRFVTWLAGWRRARGCVLFHVYRSMNVWLSTQGVPQSAVLNTRTCSPFVLRTKEYERHIIRTMALPFLLIVKQEVGRKG